VEPRDKLPLHQAGGGQLHALRTQCTLSKRQESKQGNHKDTWSDHHRRALTASQAFFATSPMSANVAFPEEALILNAFGDHFLTDAFSAGHVINKEDVIDKYRAAFYAHGTLTEAGRNFFHRVAEISFQGAVRDKFRRLETAQPYDAWWNIFRWHPNITSADRFAEVLIGAAQQEPQKIGNMAVKAIHDWLNKNGIEVTNQAGSGHLASHRRWPHDSRNARHHGQRRSPVGL
jgi:flagellar motor protein MotB